MKQLNTLVILIVIGIALWVSYSAFTVVVKTLPDALETRVEYKRATTTVFWVGEEATSENDFISNTASYWDSTWTEHFGGIDDPDCRNGYAPCEFLPLENPFYAALPYGEFENGSLKASSSAVPPSGIDNSLLKNRWIEIQFGTTTCYAQWEDVGPNNENDFEYVFGNATEPQNEFGEKAGLDVSPAVRDCLGMSGSDVTYWRLIPASQVPEGPWTNIITTRDISWQ